MGENQPLRLPNVGWHGVLRDTRPADPPAPTPPASAGEERLLVSAAESLDCYVQELRLDDTPTSNAAADVIEQEAAAIHALAAALARLRDAWRIAEHALELIATSGLDCAPGVEPEAHYRHAAYASVGTAARGLAHARRALAPAAPNPSLTTSREAP